MSDDYKQESELVEALRKNNRVRRSLEKKLRQSVTIVKTESDVLFKELCLIDESRLEAVDALEKLWAFGELTCEPLDYVFIGSSIALIAALLYQKAVVDGASHKPVHYNPFDDQPDDDDTKDFWATANFIPAHS